MKKKKPNPVRSYRFKPKTQALIKRLTKMTQDDQDGVVFKACKIYKDKVEFNANFQKTIPMVDTQTNIKEQVK